MRPTLLCIIKLREAILLRVTLNEVKGLMYQKAEILRFAQNDNQSKAIMTQYTSY
jgi:hypothetical protein